MALKYRYGEDQWEGNKIIDWSLIDAAVDFTFIRQNHTKGTLHLDEQFIAQWDLSAHYEVLRAPYFVYSPYETWRTNLDFIRTKSPREFYLIAVDVELKNPAVYNPTAFAQQLEFFIKGLQDMGKKVIIYSGGWFWQKETIAQMSWMKDLEYWWARYPTAVYPENTTNISWENLINKIEYFAWNPGTTPGKCRLWQCTADRYILPGCSTALDVNIFNGSWDDLVELFTGKTNKVPEDALEILWRMHFPEGVTNG